MRDNLFAVLKCFYAASVLLLPFQCFIGYCSRKELPLCDCRDNEYLLAYILHGKAIKKSKPISSRREKVKPELCQSCLNVPEIRKTEPSSSGGSWERRCPVHHCPIDASPSTARYHQASSSHMHAPISTRSNGQVPSGSQDSFQPHLYYHCNQQEARSSYALPPLPGHGERATLCSHHSSGDSSSTPQHEAADMRWKQWPHDQQQLRPVQHHVVTVR